MNDAYLVFYQSAMALSLLASLFVIVVTWRHRRAPGATAMTALAASTFVWTLAFLVEANSNTLDQQLFFNNVGYIGSMSVPVAWLIFSLHYTSGRRLVAGWRILPFCIVPAVTVALVWTNGWHHLMWSDEHLATSGPFTVTAKTYGRFFWIAFVHNYVLIVTGAVILTRRLFVGAPLYTRQAVSLIVAVALPLIWNFIYVFDLTPLPRKDLTPLTFAISGTVIVLGVMRFDLFRVVPFAREFLVQRLNDGLLVFDTEDRLLEVNPAALAILGADKRIIGRSLDSLSVSWPALRGLSSGESGRLELPLTVSGEERFYELETTPLHDDHEQQMGWLVILHDTTERKRMQEQLAAQDRLASIGELTLGMAHELNNPLTSIVGFSELLLERDIPADIKDDLDIIRSEAERTAGIVDSLLTFVRKQPRSKQPTDINEITKKTLELRAYEQQARSIQVDARFAPDLPPIMGNSSQLQQVFLNIIINAEYFMLEAHGKGTLTITTEKVGNSVRASVADDGPGIPQENMKRLFTPFFTTKEVGKGTGLGLSICYGIITEHGGRIWAESRPGEGTTFFVELPAHSSSVTGSK